MKVISVIFWALGLALIIGKLDPSKAERPEQAERLAAAKTEHLRLVEQVRTSGTN